jgi:hypothetical protein
MTFPHPVTARLWEPIQPIARGERYEDPLQAALQKAGLGEVDGGGSQLAANGEVSFADVAVYLADLDRAVQLTKDTLESAGAPEGSELIFAPEAARAPLPIGRLQSLALYLDGITLPEQVYAELDFDGVLADIEQVLAQASPALHDTWMGPEETALYFFGSDAEDMLKRAEATLRRIPVCQNARVVLRQGHPSLPRRELRLPRH